MPSLTITATIPLSGDLVEDAETITKLREPAAQLASAVGDAGGGALVWRQYSDIEEAPKVRRGRPRLAAAAE